MYCSLWFGWNKRVAVRFCGATLIVGSISLKNSCICQVLVIEIYFSTGRCKFFTFGVIEKLLKFIKDQEIQLHWTTSTFGNFCWSIVTQFSDFRITKLQFLQICKILVGPYIGIRNCDTTALTGQRGHMYHNRVIYFF